MTDAEKCRLNGWTVGTRLAGDEGRGVTVIELTAIGVWSILAREISRGGKPVNEWEHTWVLCCRDWKQVTP